jgi:hypothetical protein
MKILTIFIIFLFLGVGFSSAFSINTKSSNINGNHSKNEVLPDLIIKDIRYFPSATYPYWHYVIANIKNRGNDYAYGNISVQFSVVDTFFWLSNKGTIYDDINIIYLENGLAPGESRYIWLHQRMELPRFGFFKFFVNINIDKRIDERYYFNNWRMELVFIFDRFWF